MPPDIRVSSIADSLASLAASFADLAARTQTVESSVAAKVAKAAAESARNASTFERVLGMLDQLSTSVKEIQRAARHAEKQPMQAPNVTTTPPPQHTIQPVFGSYGSPPRFSPSTAIPLAIDGNQTITQRLPSDTPLLSPIAQPILGSYGSTQRPTSSTHAPLAIDNNSAIIQRLPRVDMFHPTTLPQAMDLARLTEQKLSSPRPRLFDPRPIQRPLALLPTPTVARATPVGFPSKRLMPTLFQNLVLRDVSPENEEGSRTHMEDMSFLPQDAPTVECLDTPEQLNEMSNLLKIGTKIICVGHNYATHTTKLGNGISKEPVLLMKPTSAYLENGGTIETPESYESLDHEEELAVVISKKARNVPKANARDYVGGYARALDLTTRELQSVTKSAGLSWTMAKGPPIIQCLSRHQAIQYSMFQLTLVSITELHYPNFNLEVEVSVKGGSNVAPLIDKGPVDDLADLSMTRGFSKCKIEISKGVHGMSMAWRIS